MNEEKVVIAPANNFGITIKESDIPMGKVVVNGVEVTDIESWNKAVSTFSKLEMELGEKDKKIERLQNIIREVEGMLENPWNIDCINQNNYILNKLKESKEGNKDE